MLNALSNFLRRSSLMRLKDAILGFCIGMLGAICMVFTILYMGLHTEDIIFGADKFNFFFFEFVVLMITCVIIEAVEDTGSREVAVDSILSAIIAWVVVKDNMPWLQIQDPINSAIHMLKPALWVGLISAIFSTPISKLAFNLLNKEINKN